MGYAIPRPCSNCGENLYSTSWEALLIFGFVFTLFAYLEGWLLKIVVTIPFALLCLYVSALIVPLKAKSDDK